MNLVVKTQSCFSIRTNSLSPTHVYIQISLLTFIINIKEEKQMFDSNMFFNLEFLKEGFKRINQTIQNHYEKEGTRKVQPQNELGFLKKQMNETAPQQGKSFEEILQFVEKSVLPGTLNMQSPKYFGHFSLSIADTTVLAQTLATAFHSPNAMYFFAPAYTELQNVVVDWCVKALNLSQRYLFKNLGGGIINNSASQGLFTVVHAAKMRKIRELNLSPKDPKIFDLVAYYSQFCHKSAEKALLLKDINHCRVIPCFYNQNTKNFQISVEEFENMILEDTQKGLIPFMYHGTYGSTLTNAIDISSEAIALAKKYNMWVSIDAVSMGTSFLLKENQLPESFFEKVDSTFVNFSKNLLVGNGGALLFVGDRAEFQNSITKKSDVSYYSNQHSGQYGATDYSDWTVGLDRRLNFFKFYFLFQYYGLKRLRSLIQGIEDKNKYFQKMVLENPQLFEVFTQRYTLLTLRVKNPLTGRPSNELTEKVMNLIHNTNYGYSTPGHLKKYRFIRLNFGNILTKEEDLKNYFQEIKAVSLQVQQEFMLQHANAKVENQTQILDKTESREHQRKAFQKRRFELDNFIDDVQTIESINSQ